MQIKTERFGEIEIKQDDIITVKNGLIGFEKNTRYVLIPSKEHKLLGWLQSVDNPNLAFVVADPYDIYYDYTVNIEDEVLEELDIKAKENIYVLAILVVPEKIEDISANLLAPVIINVRNRTGRQVILNNSNYQTKHYIIKDLQKAAKSDKIRSKEKLSISSK